MEFGEDFDIIVESGKADCTAMSVILEVTKGINGEENYHFYSGSVVKQHTYNGP